MRTRKIQPRKPVSGSKEDLALTRFNDSKSYWKPFFLKANSELQFLSGDQWTPQARSMRERDGRPVLQLPRLSNFIRQLTSQIRTTSQRIKVASDDSTTKATADIMSSIIRQIESKSNADSAYDIAGESAVKTGLGFIRIYSDYKHYSSFEQDLFIDAVLDPSRVFFDPSARGVIFEDAQYVFVETVMTKDEYKDIAGDDALDFIKNHGFKASSTLVTDDEHITVLEYIRKEYVTTTVYKYVDTIDNSVHIVEDNSDISTTWVLVDKKRTTKCIVKHSLFDGVEFYNTTEFPGDILPIIPVIGEQNFIDNERVIKGAISDAIDAQRLANYAASVEVEVIDLAPKTPWLIAEGSIDGYENMWRNANSTNVSCLIYKAKNGLPAPTRSPIDTPISSIATVKSQAEDDLKNIFGVFDSQMGAPGAEVSGAAITARNLAANKSTFVYRDNLSKAIRQVGKILASAIPVYYNGRTVNINKSSGNDETIIVKVDQYNNFDVSVEDGPTDETSRETLTGQLIEIMKINPTAAPLLTDIVVKNSNLLGSEAVVERLKTLLPPEIRQMEQASSPGNTAAIAIENAQLKKTLQDGAMQMEQMAKELEALKTDKLLEEQKIRQDYEIKMAELRFKATELELKYEIESEQLRLNSAKMISEASGNKHDQLPDSNI